MRFALVIALLAIGCIRDVRTFPDPQQGRDTGHCWTMFAPGVLGCTYLRDGALTNEVCVHGDGGSWWCSGPRASSAPACFLCDEAR